MNRRLPLKDFSTGINSGFCEMSADSDKIIRGRAETDAGSLIHFH